MRPTLTPTLLSSLASVFTTTTPPHIHQHLPAVAACFYCCCCCPTQNCKANNAAVGQAEPYPLNFPNGVATDGRYVWLSDKPGRVRVCSWRDNTIVDCRYTTAQSTGLRGSGALAIDYGRNLLYTVLNEQGCVMVCRNPYTLDIKCPCYTFDPISSTTTFPTGLALGYDQLWITSSKGVSRCPQRNVDGFNYNACVTKLIMDPTDPTGMTEFDARGITVDTAAGIVYIAATASDPPSVLACDRELTSCTRYLGEGTFLQGNPSTTAGPGLAGMAVSQGLLYIPLQLTRAISVCSNSATVSNCRLSEWSTTPQRASRDTVNIASIPAPVDAASSSNNIMRTSGFLPSGSEEGVYVPLNGSPSTHGSRRSAGTSGAANVSAAVLPDASPSPGVGLVRPAVLEMPTSVVEEEHGDTTTRPTAAASIGTLPAGEAQASVGAAHASVASAASSGLTAVQPAQAAAQGAAAQPSSSTSSSTAGTAALEATAWSGVLGTLAPTVPPEAPVSAHSGSSSGGSSSSHGSSNGAAASDINSAAHVLSVRQLDVWNFKDVTQSVYVTGLPYPDIQSSSSSSGSLYNVRAAVLRGRGRRGAVRSSRQGAAKPSLVLPSMQEGEVGEEAVNAANAAGGAWGASRNQSLAEL